MKQQNTIRRLILTLSPIVLLPLACLGAVQISENFEDSNWPYTNSSSAYITLTNSATGWAIDNATIYRNTSGSASNFWTSPSNSCIINVSRGLSSIRSPVISNGVGSVKFFSRGTAGFIIAVDTSNNGTSWSTIASITNSSATWSLFSTPINTTSNLQIRLRATGSSVNGYIDDVSITYPAPTVSINNLSHSPTRPTDQAPVTVSANVSIQSVADTFAMTNYWREWPSMNLTNGIAMTSNAPGLYTAVSPIPGKSIGSLVEYLAQATYTADGTTFTTNSSTNAYVVLPKSSYTNLAVIGQIASTLRNGANYQWQGVIQVTNINPTFKFQGISNAVTTTWGDVNQSVTNIPLYGQAEVTTSNITLYTTNTGYYLFAFNETNLIENYSVRSCSYEHFDTWTGATYNAFGTYTNNMWILTTGNTSNDSSRVFSGTGRSVIVETNGWVQSPYLTNGVGQISLWYRNWQTTGAPTGTFQIQTSSNAVNWTPLANGTVSNIISTNYLFYSVDASDPVSKYVRILNTNAAARICLDEVVIATPGSSVSASNFTPTNATYLDTITLSAILTPYNGATINSVTALYRVGPTGVWETVNMTSTDGTYYAISSPIIGLPVGILYYVVNCVFSGFQSDSPAVLPPGSTNEVVVGNPPDNRYERFDDSNWPFTNSSTFSMTFTNPVTGWAIKNANIYRNTGSGASNFWTSPSNSCIINPSFGASSAVTSPFFTNAAVGGVTFTSRGTEGFIVAAETSSDGSNWLTSAYVTNSTSLPWSTNAVSFGILSNSQIRIRAAGSSVNGYLDDIRVSYPPANVIVTNVYINPGYPVAGQAFTASCDVVSINPIFPAYNITPIFNYWTGTEATSTVTMARSWVAGTTNHYSGSVSLAPNSRDTTYNYSTRATFDGYYGSTRENQSPKTSIINSFTVRAYESPYRTIGVTINNALTTGRLLSNRVWQTVFTTSSTNMLSFSFSGNGFSAGNGYATNATVWGNSNASWQTTFPLADFSSTGQTAFSISGASNEFSGQYVMRFDETTGQYIILRCVSQDFDNWSSNDDLYKLEANAAVSLIQNTFDNWITNRTQTRLESFNDPRWTAINYYTNYAAAGPSGYGMFVSKIAGEAVVTTNPALIGRSFIAQGSQLHTETETEPLKGVGTVSFKYQCSVITNNSIGVYLYTNAFSNPDEYALFGRWISVTNSTVSNTAPAIYTVTLNTNASADIIIAHLTGNATVTFDDISVSEWYADSQTNNDWYTSEAWVEPRTGAAGNCLRFDTSRANAGSEQFVVTPMLTNGVNTITFDYCSASTLPVSFSIDTRTGLYGSWSNLVSTNMSGFTGTATDYRNYSWPVTTPATNTYLKITHTTNAPGILLIDNVKISGATVGATWEINNVAIDDTDQPIPPQVLGLRQYYDGFCTLNRNRTSNLASSPLLPYTNTWPYIVSPMLSAGIGEISFRYRNWTTSGAVTPARLIIQTTANLLASTNDAIWTTVSTLDNIVNTNDYQYYSYIVNNSTSRYARIYSDDQFTSQVGRVCMDDILVAEPLAATLSMSNLVITPSIPLYSNTVQIAADICKLFLAPSNITLTAYYATATTYAALSSATSIPLTMSCIASNTSAPGQWYRYQTTTSIPTNSVDTFVKYYVKASYGGYQAASTSPRTLASFGVYPTWYAPMDTVYTNGIAYYVVYSCPTGSVWINEINALDWSDDWSTYIFTNEYIELAGPGNTSIKNWTIQLVDLYANPVATYTITNNTILSATTNGYGFWLLGVTNISNKDQTLSTDVVEAWDPVIGVQKMPVQGGIKLKRSWGPVEEAIFYNTDIASVPPGYVLAGTDSLTYSGGALAIQGSNTNFFWTELNSWSPGSINNGQTLIGITIQGTPPVVYIYSIWINTNVWIECTKTTNWHTIPWYTTNLLSSNVWISIPSFTRTISGTNDLLNFNRQTNNNTYFYKVVSTNAP